MSKQNQEETSSKLKIDQLATYIIQVGGYLDEN
jgi:hypothetical protein